MTIEHGQDPVALRRLWQEAFGDTDAFLDGFFATAYAPERCFAAMEDGQLAGALYWFDCTCRGEKVAYLYAVATAKAFRGRGVCTRLMTHTHDHLARSGYATALLVPGNAPLFQFYGKMNYRPFMEASTTTFVCAQPPASVTAVSAEEYARLRRALLPEGGVVQEGENLTFLATQTRLYAGEDWILAAHEEKAHLSAAEYLGDPKYLPHILCALGYTKGSAPIPGGAFRAMYLPLKETPPPTYLGLAFD